MLVRSATEEDVPLILALIRELAEYERLAHEVIATEEGLRGWLFGERQVAEALIGDTGRAVRKNRDRRVRT